jgi:hypothetical protein
MAWKVRVSDPRTHVNVRGLAFGLVAGGSAIAGAPVNSGSETTAKRVPMRSNLMMLLLIAKTDQERSPQTPLEHRPFALERSLGDQGPFDLRLWNTGTRTPDLLAARHVVMRP